MKTEIDRMYELQWKRWRDGWNAPHPLDLNPEDVFKAGWNAAMDVIAIALRETSGVPHLPN